MNKLNNFLSIAAVFSFLLALIVLGIFGNLTGHATDTGEANVTIGSEASIQFITDSINWGAGAVNETPTFATIDTEGNVTDGNWTAVTQGLTLQNDGNSNVFLTLNTSNVAADFIGGTSPEYNIKLTNNESFSCAGTNSLETYTPATGEAQNACDNWSYLDTKDTLDVDIELVIPEDATPGTKSSTITATATVI